MKNQTRHRDTYFNLPTSVNYVAIVGDDNESAVELLHTHRARLMQFSLFLQAHFLKQQHYHEI